MVMNIADEKFERDLIDNRARGVAHLFIDRVAKSGQDEAYRFPQGGAWKSMTWAQTDTHARQIAAGLVALGVDAEDRVAIASSTRLGGSSRTWATCSLARRRRPCTRRADSPTSSTSSPTRARASCSPRTPIQVEKLRSGREQIPDVVKVVVFGGEGDGEWVMTLDELRELGRTRLEETPDVIDDRVASIKPQHLATLIYTSGTTGKAKGVRLSHDCWTYEASAVDSTGLLNAGDVQYLWLPLSHVFGKMLLCLPIRSVSDGRRRSRRQDHRQPARDAADVDGRRAAHLREGVRQDQHDDGGRRRRRNSSCTAGPWRSARRWPTARRRPPALRASRDRVQVGRQDHPVEDPRPLRQSRALLHLRFGGAQQGHRAVVLRDLVCRSSRATACRSRRRRRASTVPTSARTRSAPSVGRCRAPSSSSVRTTNCSSRVPASCRATGTSSARPPRC